MHSGVHLSKVVKFQEQGVSNIWARVTRAAHICDHVQAIGLVAVKEEAHEGLRQSTNVESRQADNIQDRHIWTIPRINLLCIPCNKLGIQSVCPIALTINLPLCLYKWG
jgi:hypothetical protein